MCGYTGREGTQSHAVKETRTSAMGEDRVLDERIDSPKGNKGGFAPEIITVLAALDEVPLRFGGTGGWLGTGGCFLSHDSTELPVLLQERSWWCIWGIDPSKLGLSRIYVVYRCTTNCYQQSALAFFGEIAIIAMRDNLEHTGDYQIGRTRAVRIIRYTAPKEVLEMESSGARSQSWSYRASELRKLRRGPGCLVTQQGQPVPCRPSSLAALSACSLDIGTMPPK